MYLSKTVSTVTQLKGRSGKPNSTHDAERDSQEDDDDDDDGKPTKIKVPWQNK
jgi:hypothetical protein